MKLTTQGLLVIFFPLAFQLVLVATLLILLFQAQDQVTQAARSEGVINQCNLIIRRVFDGLEVFIEAKIEPGTEAKSMVKITDNFNNQVQKLHTLIANDPIPRKAAILLLDEAQNVTKLGMRASGHILDKTELKSAIVSRRLIHILTLIVDAETQQRQANNVRTQRTAMKSILLAAALFGIALSALIAVLCAIHLRKLLSSIAENAMRFSRREPLAPELSGTDELARLDQVFHAMDIAVESALQTSRALIDNAADLVCSIDRNGIFQSANRFSRKLIGYEPTELIGKSIVDLVVAEDCARADEAINQSFSSERGNLFDLRLEASDDRVVETAWSTFWSEADGSLFCVVGDITERKKIEHLKQDFIAMISKDLRTPLMSVLSSIELVKTGQLGEVGDGVVRDLAGAEKTLDRLITMVNDLLDFEKLGAGKMQFSLKTVSIDTVISESFREVNAVAQTKNVALVSDSTGLSVLGDQEKLIQLLINLLANAIRYSPDHSAVTVTAEEKDGTVEVSVLDNGPGVPDQFHEKVFAPFESAPGSKVTAEGGTGLGLAICKLIVEGHHGEIGVRNREVSGSQFWFTIPSAVEPVID